MLIGNTTSISLFTNIQGVFRQGVRNVFRALGFWEKTLIVGLIFIALGVSVYWIGALYMANTREVPAYGGKYREGIAGQPRYINPILSQTSDADADLVELIFAGLYSYGNDGRLKPEVAESLEVSEDGKMYTVKLKEGVVFHDGTEVTTDDVAFTVQAIQNPTNKSPLRQNWQTVDVRVVDRRTIIFELKKPYFGFLENLTVGILPKHLWSDISADRFLLADYNLEPIGCGPYRYVDATKDSNGNILEYELRAFERFFDGMPYISQFVFRFYSDEESLIDGYLRKEVSGMQGISADGISRLSERKSTVIRDIKTPRSFAVFFNPTASVALAFDEVREALNRGTDRQAIIRELLGGRGTEVLGPFPPFMDKYATDLAWPTYNQEEANRLLDEKGWVRNAESIREKSGIPLRIDLIVPDWLELVKTAEILKTQWQPLGIGLEIIVMSPGDLQRNVVQTREYQALLYGEQPMLDQDPYSFWHSSQKRESGLNLALFDNANVDEMLVAARETLDDDRRRTLYRDFQAAYLAEMPALFLFSPSYLSVTDGSVRGVDIERMNASSERFAGVNRWYVNTKRLWK
ncbi:MAG: peptide ABC transporter substrate-binding protein [Candidatus Moranbacteria bacterium]|nr:peptide ABC transporter substrate-binding protein [Candidatus Moranbacteria bacterium]